ncbi:MAG: CheR family methyltransferase [Pseudomonadota bacterium]
MSSNPPSSDAAHREFAYTESDFERIRQLIFKHAGIALNPSKYDMVYNRLARRLRATRTTSFNEYLALLDSSLSNEWQAFVNSLTTNLTSFFREAHHFPLLAEHMLKHRHRRVALWCSAASTGEEPYSMAMTAVDAYGSFTPPVTIIASDIDTHALKQGEAGIYPVEHVEKLPAETVRRFFIRETGESQDHVRVRPELRAMVTFRQVNLVDGNWPLRGPLDAIFCRNVMIYFDKETQLGILHKFAPLMQPDGLLFAGHSESFRHAAHLFRLRGRAVYERYSSDPANAGDRPGVVVADTLKKK